MDTDQIRIVVFQDGDTWVAQCLEYDIGAQAESLEKLYECLAVVIDAEREESQNRHGQEFAGIPEAPENFHKLYEKRAGRFLPEDSVSVESNLTFALCA